MSNGKETVAFFTNLVDIACSYAENGNHIVKRPKGICFDPLIETIVVPSILCSSSQFVSLNIKKQYFCLMLLSVFLYSIIAISEIVSLPSAL